MLNSACRILRVCDFVSGVRRFEGTKQVLLCHCFVSWTTIACDGAPDILLFDKPPIAPFVCQRMIRHVLTPLFLSLLCAVSHLRIMISGKKGSLVTASYLFYFATLQMTTKTLYLWGLRLTDKAARLIKFKSLAFVNIASILNAH